MTTYQIPSQDTRLSVIMFSDIVGYSKKMNDDEALTMTLLDRHNEIVRGAIKRHDGTEIKVIGDAFLVSFSTAANAVRCAIDIQESLSRYNDNMPEKEKILVRIGIHMGDIIIKENDVFGDGVNIASRIEPLAKPGGICISQEVYSMVRHKLDLQVVSLGPRDLKNIKNKIEIYQILVGSITEQHLKSKRMRTLRGKKAFYVRPLTIVIVAGLFVVALFLFFLFDWTGRNASEQVQARWLKLPQSDANNPNISSDGNWIVYVGLDVTSNKGTGSSQKGLFVVPAAGGESRRITLDSTLTPEDPCFSPDASHIAFDSPIFNPGNFSFDLFIVPFLGGTPRKVIKNAILPIWSPDGQWIAFFTFYDKKLCIVRPDGSSNKIIAEIKNMSVMSAAWSPDSKKIAFLRNFMDTDGSFFTEIFLRGLEDITEQQITFEKKIIDDFCWSSTGELIFNSSKSGTVNLWCIPENGGLQKRITLGAGSDLFPRISKDSRRLVYVTESETINLWEINLQTRESQQLTFENARLAQPKFSWDGSKLFYLQRESSPAPRSFIAMRNFDGSNAAAIEIPLNISDMWLWNPTDGNMIYFNKMQRDTVRRNPDSVVVKLTIFSYNITNKAEKSIVDGMFLSLSHDGRYILYISSETVDSFNDPELILYSLSDQQTQKFIFGKYGRGAGFSSDSRYIITTDSAGKKYTPIRKGDSPKVLQTPRTPRGFDLYGISQDDKLVYGSIFEKNELTLYRFVRSSGKLEKLWTRPQDMGNFGFNFSPDFKHLVIPKKEVKNRIMILDNFR